MSEKNSGPSERDPDVSYEVWKQADEDVRDPVTRTT